MSSGGVVGSRSNKSTNMADANLAIWEQLEAAVQKILKCEHSQICFEQLYRYRI
jgi:hypothetical protein